MLFVFVESGRMAEITLLRHGQSTMNVNLDYSIVDPTLTELGRQQAEQIQPEHFNLVICSTLTRAKQTLEYATKITYDKVC